MYCRISGLGIQALVTALGHKQPFARDYLNVCFPGGKADVNEALIQTDAPECLLFSRAVTQIMDNRRN